MSFGTIPRLSWRGCCDQNNSDDLGGGAGRAAAGGRDQESYQKKEALMVTVFGSAFVVWLLFKVSKAMAGLLLLGLLILAPVKTILVLAILIALSSLM